MPKAWMRWTPKSETPFSLIDMARKKCIKFEKGILCKGDKIVYKTHKEGKNRYVKIDEVFEEFKNKSPGFVGMGYRRGNKDTTYWGSTSQILRKIKQK